jgi:hypothetical protein
VPLFVRIFISRSGCWRKCLFKRTTVSASGCLLSTIYILVSSLPEPRLVNIRKRETSQVIHDIRSCGKVGFGISWREMEE